MIDKATVQRIKDAADIVEVVSDYVHLTRRGANYMGLCPFHNEKTPSFSVNRRRNFCYCFSCHKGGSPVNFIMEKEGISYHDALLQLAKKYGIKVEERELTDEERRLATEREGLLVAAERAMRIMEENLSSTDEGRDIGLTYLYSRGVTEEAIRKFHLGYSPDNGSHITQKMLKEGFEADVLRTLGISGMSQNGNLYDKYRGRVIFPIMNSSGKTVGFGGRDLKGGPAKYINSPESVLYHKNNELYGIFQAKNEIVRQDKCFLVEGYLDVISMWQSGMQNVVASSGTALTDGQIAMIHRFTNNITLLYDGDSAGIKAALRGIDMLLNHNMKVSVLLLPDGDDPDSFARKHTPEVFREYVAMHETDILRFKMQVLLDDAGDNPQKKAAVISSVVESLANISDSVERSVYVRECSIMMNIDESAVASAVEKARFRILEAQRKERNRRRAQIDYPDIPASENEKPENADSSEKVDETAIIARKLTDKALKRQSPLYPLEKAMIRQIVRYGYMNLSSAQTKENEESKNDVETEYDTRRESDNNSENGENPDELYTVVDFVRDELEVDAIDFSVPEFKKLFETLLEHIDEYIEKLDEYRVTVEKEISAEREKGRAEIASSYTNINDISIAERRLEERLSKLRRDRCNEFSRYYPGDFLASHEDADLRRMATEMVNDKYVLSNLFVSNSGKEDDDDLASVISRALTEWKSEILAQHIRELLDEFRETSGQNEEKDREMMFKINRLMTLSSNIAKNIGDRILNPRRR